MSKVLELAPDEAIEYEGLPKDVILTRYMKRHRWDRCPHCGKMVGNHSLKKFRHCVDHDENMAKIKKIQPNISFIE